MKNIRYLLMIIYISAFLTASPLLAGVRPLSIIYPGEGVGIIRLGDRMERVIRMLEWGEPEELTKGEGAEKYYFIYKKIGIVLVFEGGRDTRQIGDATLTRIIVTSPAFITAGSGIRVGDKDPERLFTQGKLPESYREGITYNVNKETDVVESIEVFGPN